jgi:hypothetical protein
MNIAAVINNLGPSQNSYYLIKEFNKVASNRHMSLSVFFERSAIPIIPTMFSCKSISFISSYHHNAIATSLEETDILLKANNASKKFLYLWDLEWIRNTGQYDTISNILLNDRLNIIARSESHATMIENFCNKKPVGIVDNWNINQLIEVIQNV